MGLTPWEEERLVSSRLPSWRGAIVRPGCWWMPPRPSALICDAMLEAARAGASFENVEAAGRAAVAFDDALPGVRELISEVALEVLVGDGTRLVLLLDPLAGGRPGTDKLGARGTYQMSPTV